MLSESEIAERIEAGEVQVLITFEVAGKPPSHVDETLDKLHKTLDEDDNVILLHVERGEVIELEDEEGIFTGFIEAEMIVPKLATLNFLMVNWSPASIEILQPESFQLTAEEMQGYLNDTLSKLHVVAQTMRNEGQRNKHLNTNLRTLIHNFTTVLLAAGPKTTEQLQKFTGTTLEVINKVLSNMKDSGEVEQKGETWTLASAKK